MTDETTSCSKKLEALERYISSRFESFDKLQNERQKNFHERLLSVQKASEALVNNYEIRHSAALTQIDKNTDRLTILETALATRKEGLGITGVLILGGFSAMASVISVITLIVHIYKPS